MTPNDLAAMQAWFVVYTGTFRNRDGSLDMMLEQKLCHSIRVAENAKRISCVLQWSECDQRMARGLGLIHDVGRFTQFAHYGSFQDASTIDHGVAGRHLIESLDESWSTSSDRQVILSVVEYHNKGLLPEGLTDRQNQFLRLIRDADKLDILDYVLMELARDGFSKLGTMLPKIRLVRDIDEKVLTEAYETGGVRISNVSTLGDFLIMLATWVNDLNYTPSVELFQSRHILDRLRSQLPETEQINQLFDQLISRAERIPQVVSC